MKFKISPKVKGSLILKSIGRPVTAGTTVYVEGNNLYADDIKRAIKSGLLITDESGIEDEVKKDIMNKTSEVVIINKTDRVVIIGNIPIRPNSSAIREIDSLDMGVIRKSIETGLIQVITDVDNDLFAEKETKKIVTNEVEKIKLEDGIDILEEKCASSEKDDSNLSPEKELAKIIEDAESKNDNEEDETHSFVWDFRTQEKKKPQVVPKPGQKIIDLNEDEEDVEMIDVLDKANDAENSETTVELISNKIEDIKKKISQKKSSKKKDIPSVKLKITTELEESDVLPLDSMGRPLKDDMSHMIDGFDKEEISFADQEQSQISMDKAKKNDSSINIDLD